MTNAIDSEQNPENWLLLPPVAAESNCDPYCDHEPVTGDDGVIKCGRCGASEQEIDEQREAQFEADKALGVYPELDYAMDVGPDSEDCAFGPRAGVEDDGEDF